MTALKVWFGLWVVTTLVMVATFVGVAADSSSGLDAGWVVGMSLITGFLSFGFFALVAMLVAAAWGSPRRSRR